MHIQNEKLYPREFILGLIAACYETIVELRTMRHFRLLWEVMYVRYTACKHKRNSNLSENYSVLEDDIREYK